MINIKKVVNEIAYDGKYDEILDHVKVALDTKEPDLKQIFKLVNEDELYIKEYKDLNRWGELSSVHVNELDIKDEDSQESIKIKNQINKDVKFLINLEEYEIPSKNVIYLAWTGFIALPSIYVIDNIVRLSTDLYKDNQENSVYLSFLLVVLIAGWGFFRVVKNHKQKHEKYMRTQKETRELIKLGIENGYFTEQDVYQD